MRKFLGTGFHFLLSKANDPINNHRKLRCASVGKKRGLSCQSLVFSDPCGKARCALAACMRVLTGCLKGGYWLSGEQAAH